MKKLVSVLLVAIMVVALLAGCGTPAKDQNASTPESTAAVASTAAQTPEPAKLSGSITVFTQSDTTESKFISKGIDQFMKANPDVKVTQEAPADDYMQALQQRFAANNAPDVFWLDIAQAQGLIYTNKVEPLDDYITKSNFDINDFPAALLEGYKANGKLYGIPKDFNMLGLYYNTDMFAKAGITAPPKTWEELKEDAKKLTSKDVYGISFQNELARFQPIAIQNGAVFVKPGDKGPKVNTPEIVEAAEYWLSFFKDKTAVKPADIGEGWDGDVFGKGKAAMTFEGGWMSKYMQSQYPDIKWSVAELPGHKQQGTLEFANSWSVASTSANKDLAFAYVAFVSSPDGCRLQFPDQNAFPPRTSLMKEYSDMYPTWAAFTNEASYAVPFSYGLVGPTTLSEFGNALEAAKAGTTDIKAALDTAQANIDKAVADLK